MLIARRLISTMSILMPPESVRGMTKLEKAAFQKTFTFPIIEIDARDVGIISRRVRLEKFLIGSKLKPLKNFMDTTEENGAEKEADEKNPKKIMVFHPEKVADDATKQSILELIARELPEKSLTWKTCQKQLNFENWDAKSIFKAILPEGVEYSAYTQTGHIIHCNFADETLPYRFVIAEVLLNKIQNCKTVVQKGNIITNVFRNLDLELLAGEHNYITEIKETGLRFRMDFSKVYWNSRLSHEHERIAAAFNTQSLIYDACCGIGPFVLPAIVKRKPRRVMANDLNPESVRWLRENLKINRIPDTKLDVFNEDAQQFIRERVAEDVMQFWRLDAEDSEASLRDSEVHVVMNLPAYAVNFLPAFRGVLRRFSEEIKAGEGRIRMYKWNVYCYLFAKSHVDVPDAWYEAEARRMCDEQTKWEKSLVVKCHNVRTVSSRKEMFCAHLELPLDFLIAEPLPEQPTVVEFEPEESEEPKRKREKLETSN